jgi:hypothetical protein
MKGVYYVTHSGEVEREKYVCGICGFALTELGECPRCEMQIEQTARGLRQRKQRDEWTREMDQVVGEQWDESEDGSSEVRS